MPRYFAPAPPSRESLRMLAEGIKGENFSRQAANASTIAVDGTVYYALLGFAGGDVVTNIHVSVTTASSGSTLSKVGVYQTDGTRLALSADLGTAWQSAGAKTHALTSPLTIPTSGGYYLALVAKASTTLPTFLRMNNSTAPNNAIGSGAAPMATQTGQTDLPSPGTPAQASLLGYWFAWS